MRFLLLIFLFVFSLNVGAQSPAVNDLVATGTRQANAGAFEPALKSFKTALLAAEKQYLGASYRARLQYNIGVCYLGLERFDPAADHFKAALLLKTDYTRAYSALGVAETRKRRLAAAETSAALFGN